MNKVTFESSDCGEYVPMGSLFVIKGCGTYPSILAEVAAHKAAVISLRDGCRWTDGFLIFKGGVTMPELMNYLNGEEGDTRGLVVTMLNKVVITKESE